jgi:hypothetical protein
VKLHEPEPPATADGPRRKPSVKPGDAITTMSVPNRV